MKKAKNATARPLDREERLNRVFSALADPTRRAILEKLTVQEMRVTDLAEPFAMSLPAVSKHLRVLQDAELVIQDKEGRVRRCRLDAAPLEDCDQWIAKYRVFWAQQLKSLEDYLGGLDD